MKKNIFLLLALLCIPFECVSQHKLHFYTLKKDFLENYSLAKSRYGRLVRHAFASVDYLQDYKSNFDKSIISSDVKKLFLADLQQNHVIIQARMLMIAYLYISFFKTHTRKTYDFLKEVIYAKNYWKYELIKEQSVVYKKYPTYLFHGSTLVKVIKKRIVLFERLEQELSYNLGMAFYGLQKIQNLNDINAIEEIVLESVKHVYDYLGYTTTEELSSEALFKDLQRISHRIQMKHVVVQKALYEHGVPHHIMRNGFVYSSLALAGFTGLIWYQLNKDKIPEYKKRAKDSYDYFIKEYVQVPILGLKQALWDAPGKNTPQLPIPEGWTNCWSLEKAGLQTWANFIRYTFREELKLVNDGIKELKERQQINYYLSSIVPIILLIYGIYRYSSSVYNHESYFNPMRLIIRDIDILLNKISTDTDTYHFAASGRLYFLASQLKHYTNCLTSEELIAIREDVKELLSLQYTCEQKQRVLERMYRTYQFLK